MSLTAAQPTRRTLALALLLGLVACDSAPCELEGRPVYTWPETRSWDVVPFGEGVLVTVEQELWVSDGTEIGTRAVPLSISRGWVLAGERIVAMDFDKLWVLDGVDAEPIAVASDLTGFGTDFVFGFADLALISIHGDDGARLLVSDGTVAGTTKLLDRVIRFVHRFGDLAMFSSNVDAQLIWRTDGTPGGTHLLADVPYSHGFDSGELFAFATGYHTALWCTDGTSPGTHEVGPIDPGHELVGAVGRWGLYHAADGLDAVDLVTGEIERLVSASGTIQEPTSHDGRAFFQLGQAHGAELWSTDGTPAGTRRVSIQPERRYQVRSTGDSLTWWTEDAERSQLWRYRGGVVDRVAKLRGVGTHVTEAAGRLWATSRHEEAARLWSFDASPGCE